MTQSPAPSSDKRIEVILQQLEEIPALPPIAQAVLALRGADAAVAAKLAELLDSDAPLAARALKLIVRPDRSPPSASVAETVAARGVETVRYAVLALCIYDHFAAHDQSSGNPFSRDDFWKHAVAVGCCAELLACELNNLWGKDAGIDPSEAFVCGLLHDLGKLALDAVLPKSFSRAVEAAEMLRGNIADVERNVIGLDHMVAGKRLAERWDLPMIVRDCIWLHGQSPQALPATVKRPRLVNLITLADRLTREQHLGYSGNYIFTLQRQGLLDAVGLTPEQLEVVQRALVEQIEPRAAALGIGQANSGLLYQHALGQANQALQRAQHELHDKNKRLAIRARFFEALAGFQGELRPDAPPQMALRAVGQTAVGVLDVTSAAAFSLIPGQDFAEVLLFDSNGDVFESTLVDCPRRPELPAEGDGPVLCAGENLEWLLQAISPRLAHEQRYWICLEADKLCIGGIIWGGLPGEAVRLGPLVQELLAIAAGWSLALRTAQIREEARALAEQLAETHRKLQSAQAEILRSKTMITVGEMAAGAAHEMNNPLAVISGRSQLLSSQLTDPKVKAAAHLIFEQSHRLTNIITELMDFAKPEPPRPAEVDLADLIERALHEAKMAGEPADRSIEVTLGDVPPVIVDKDQVRAALLELIDNAIHATDEHKGHIAVHAAYDPYSRKVVVTVSDNGCGMDENTLKRAFDPFFSSRPAGRRRGMGLAKALRWVEASGGSIKLESRPGQGTRSLVLLPAAQPPAQQQPKPMRTRRAAQ
jgi:signal transduction histidine kinase/HD-like signal output (HDOD) protein